ncbi:hypothetical protein MNBD_GAMMA26-924 [hydrothermal vent metagenome]|uniref:Uncharacterized protein n=1 Tax=hydrothermal vent metagenome TaxID=652676 RepID=A0A3B1BIQ8_9ZZZZ
MNFLFNDDPRTDLLNLLAFLDQFARDYGIHPIEVDDHAVDLVVKNMRYDFPCKDGIEGSSIFKKAASFALHFVNERPIANPLSVDVFSSDLVKTPNHQNGLFAVVIACEGMHRASIRRHDGSIIVIENPIEVSQHSFVDIVDAVTSTSHVVGFKLLTILFEQLAYKTNPDCQYPTKPM